MKITTSILFAAFQLKFLVSFKIKCHFDVYGYAVGNEKLMEKYGCHAVVKPNGEENYITEVSHNHIGWKSDFDVKCFIYKHGQVIPRLPKFTSIFFPELEAFSASNVSLEVISANDFINMPKTLQVIYLYSNKLKEIPSDLFKYTPNVAAISIDRNQIQNVGSHFFNYLNLKKLRFLSTYKNSCIPNDFPNVENGNAEQFEKLRMKLLNSCKLTEAMIREEERKADEMNNHYLHHFKKFQ
jgi:Leucine-rich repeat (LRR) protein